MKTAAQRKHEGQASANGRFLRINDVVATVGLSRATIYRLVGARLFPEKARLTARAVGCLESDVTAWLESRLSAT